MLDVLNRLLLLCKLLSLQFQLNSILLAPLAPRPHLLVLLSSKDHFSNGLFVSTYTFNCIHLKKGKSRVPNHRNRAIVKLKNTQTLLNILGSPLNWDTIQSEKCCCQLWVRKSSRPSSIKAKRVEGSKMPTEGLLVQPSTSLLSHKHISYENKAIYKDTLRYLFYSFFEK